MAACTVHSSTKQSKLFERAGYFGAVKLANTLQGSVWRSKQISSDKNVVIKVTNKNLHSRSITIVNGSQYKINEDIKTEKQILKYLTKQQPPNSIVKYVDFFKSNVNYYLVEEDGGNSLFRFVQKAHIFLSRQQIEISEWHNLAKIIFKRMIESIEYIHSKNVCHFDVSLENFLISDIDVELLDDIGFQKIHFVITDGKNVEVKLCDFGVAVLFSDDSNFDSDRFAGKPNYKSPEVTNKKKSFDAKKNDIFGLGVCLFMMIIGSAPWYKTCKSDKRFTKIMNGDILNLLQDWNKSHYVNDELIELFGLIFQFEHNRADIEQIKGCKWLKN